MKKIQNHNAGVSMCLEVDCDKKPEYYTVIGFLDMFGSEPLRIHIPLCKKHAKLWENSLLQTIYERRDW